MRSTSARSARGCQSRRRSNRSINRVNSGVGSATYQNLTAAHREDLPGDEEVERPVEPVARFHQHVGVIVEGMVRCDEQAATLLQGAPWVFEAEQLHVHDALRAAELPPAWAAPEADPPRA